MNKQALTILAGIAAIAMAGVLYAGLSASSPPNQSAATEQVSPSPAAQPVRKVSPAEASALLTEKQSDPSFIVLDVRTADEFAGGHIRNAQNIDYYAPDISARLAALDRSKSYFVYCRSGNRSALVTEMMRPLGFDGVYELTGGILAWQAASLPVE